MKYGKNNKELFNKIIETMNDMKNDLKKDAGWVVYSLSYNFDDEDVLFELFQKECLNSVSDKDKRDAFLCELRKSIGNYILESHKIPTINWTTYDLKIYGEKIKFNRLLNISVDKSLSSLLNLLKTNNNLEITLMDPKCIMLPEVDRKSLIIKNAFAIKHKSFENNAVFTELCFEEKLSVYFIYY